MHELGVAESILKKVLDVAKQNNAATVTNVVIKVGTLSGVEPQSLQFALDCIKDGTIASNAIFKINIIKALGNCYACYKDSIPKTFFSICEHCGDPMMEITAGQELEIEYIDVD
jgi:hydrogenase nickel incorporation protein HypA/HybF